MDSRDCNIVNIWSAHYLGDFGATGSAMDSCGGGGGSSGGSNVQQPSNNEGGQLEGAAPAAEAAPAPVMDVIGGDEGLNLVMLIVILIAWLAQYTMPGSCTC